MKNSLLRAVAALVALASLGSNFVESARAAGTPPPPGMILWLPLDEPAGPVAANLIPGTPSGAWNGVPTVVPEYVARGLCFDGTGSSWVEVPNYPALEIGTNDFTMDCWMRFDAPSAAGDYILINKYSGVNAGQQWGYGLALSNGRLHCRFADGSIGAYSDTAYVFIPDPSTWHHVAVTVRRGLAGGGQFYVDGVPTGGFNPTAHPGSVANGQPLRLAKAINALLPPPWSGCLDEVEVFNRALSPTEIAALFTAGRDGKFKPSCAPATGYALCFNTGMSASGVALPAGTVDPLFQAASPNFINYPNAYVQGLPAYPLWNSTPALSQWITPNANALNYVQFNTYTFRTTFLLPNPIGSHIVGRWLAGGVGRIVVNGTPQPAWNTPLPPTFGATTWTPVNITAGLVAGLNTLDFEVDAWSATPCGMRAELCATSPPPANCVAITCPADTEVWICGTNNIVAAYTATAANTCGGAANLLCQPPAGTSLPPGTNTVQCTAYNGLGACASCSFKIVVRRDTNAPVVLCPGDLTEYACGGAASGPVNFAVTASDGSGVTPTVVCTNQSGQPVTTGQMFPLGTTTVTCFATDGCGHTGQCSFVVTVLNPLLPFAFSAGVHNNGAGALAGGTPEPATVGPCLSAAYPVPGLPWKIFDVTDPDRWFGHEFSWLPANLMRARLDAVMSPASFSLYSAPVTTNDSLSLHHLTCAPGGGFAWGQQIWQLPGAGGNWNISLFPNWHTITLDLTNLPPGFPGNTNNLLPLLNSPGHNRLEVLVQDDTTVDYLRLSGTFCPGGPFLGGVPVVLGAGVTLVHVPGAAAALRLAAPSTGEVTLATIPLNGADGLALSGAGWGTADLDQDGATDPAEAFSAVHWGTCLPGSCREFEAKWTPDGRLAVWVDPLQDRYSNLTVRVRFRDDAGNESPSPLVANSFPAQFSFEAIPLSAMPTTNVTCPDLWERPRLTIFNPTPASGTNGILLFSISAACGQLLTNTTGGPAFATMDYLLKFGDIEGESRPKKSVPSVVLTSRGTTGVTVAQLRPVLLERMGPSSSGQRGRRQYTPVIIRKDIDRTTPPGIFLPHPGGWNATGLGSNSTVSLRLDGLAPSMEVALAPGGFFDVFPVLEDDVWITSHVRGQVNGGADQVIDSCTARLVTNSVAGGAGVRLESDFSALGAATFRVQLYSAAHVLLRDRAGNTADAGLAGAWPDRWGTLGGPARARTFSWDSPTHYILGTQTHSNVAFALIIAEEGSVAPLIDGVTGLDFDTVGVPMVDLGALRTDLGAQRVVSIAPDGTSFRVTWSPPGGQLQTSTNLIEWTGSTNASGQVPAGPLPARFFRVRE